MHSGEIELPLLQTAAIFHRSGRIREPNTGIIHDDTHRKAHKKYDFMAAEIEWVIDALTAPSFRRAEFPKDLDRSYRPIEPFTAIE